MPSPNHSHFFYHFPSSTQPSHPNDDPTQYSFLELWKRISKKKYHRYLTNKWIIEKIPISRRDPNSASLRTRSGTTLPVLAVRGRRWIACARKLLTGATMTGGIVCRRPGDHLLPIWSRTAICRSKILSKIYAPATIITMPEEISPAL